MHKSVAPALILTLAVTAALTAHAWAWGPVCAPQMQVCAPPIQMCAPQAPVCAPQYPVCGPPPRMRAPRYQACAPQMIPCSPGFYGHPGPYPVYDEQRSAGCLWAFDMLTGMFAAPFKMGDSVMDHWVAPPNCMPGPVNRYRAYCSPPICVPPWQPAPYCAPPVCPPRMQYRMVAPAPPPLPRKYTPRPHPPVRTRSPMGPRVSIPVRIIADPTDGIFGSNW